MIPIYLLIFFFSVFIIYIVRKFTRNYDYFEKRQIKYFKPYPLIGTNIWILQKKALAYDILEKCEHFKNEKIFGLFDFLQPALVINDPEHIKRITIKDFDHFTDHRTFLNPKPGSPASSILLMMKGRKWHEMRTGLSPIFTTSKMRLMFDLISKCSHQLVENLKKDRADKHDFQTYDMKYICTKYTCDVIASCAFGFQSDSFREPHNTFYELGKSLLGFRTPKMFVKLMMMRFLPSLADLLGMSMFDKKASKHFVRLIVETMMDREKNAIIRPDMINLLLQLKKGHLKHSEADDSNLNKDNVIKRSWTDQELIAQCFVFFVAGFETVSTLLVFTAYELALNQDIQSKLREEIVTVQNNLDADQRVTYEAIHSMKYMDMVVSEALRKWPPAPIVDRLCTKPYRYDNDGQIFNVIVGDLIWIPIYRMHHNPEYFAEPHKFDPERFSDENKQFIHPQTYLPFGSGPRICIGSRFALIEVKTLLFHLLSAFTLNICEKTPIPLRLRGSVLGMAPDKPVILKLTPNLQQ